MYTCPVLAPRHLTTTAQWRADVAGAAFTLALNQSGTVSLAAQSLLALNPGETIVNNGNAIEGYGQIGDGGDNNLTLNNAAGIVDANVSTRRSW